MRAVSARQEWILTFVKWVLFFLGPWLLVYQFIDISNQIEANGHVLNFGKNNLCNSLSYKKIVFEVWDVAIYLHLIENFCKLAHYLRAKELRKNVPILQEGIFTPVPPTPPVIKVVLLHKKAVCEIFSVQYCIFIWIF